MPTLLITYDKCGALLLVRVALLKYEKFGALVLVHMCVFKVW